MNKMQDISDLLQEAKPLYYRRKSRRNQLKATFAVVVCFWSLTWFAPYPSPYAYNFDNIDEQLNLTQTGSIIEDMGLPIDEYGLLKVV